MKGFTSVFFPITDSGVLSSAHYLSVTVAVYIAAWKCSRYVKVRAGNNCPSVEMSVRRNVRRPTERQNAAHYRRPASSLGASWKFSAKLDDKAEITYGKKHGLTQNKRMNGASRSTSKLFYVHVHMGKNVTPSKIPRIQSLRSVSAGVLSWF